MDGFDDLLSSSRHPFEDNPFANPFDKPRSSSPDPWSTFAQQEQQQHEAYSGGFEGFQTSVVPAKDDDGHEAQPPSKAHELEDEGPLQNHDSDGSTAANDVGEETESVIGAGDLQSPGFRESISTDDHETKEEESTEPPIISKSEVDDDRPQPTVHTPSQSTVPRSPTSGKTEQGRSFTSPSPTSAKRFVSPLESPGPGVVAAFASLALGGESAGGWQDAPVDYSVPTSQKSEDSRRDEAVEPASEAAEEVCAFSYRLDCGSNDQPTSQP